MAPNADDFTELNLYSVLHSLADGVTLANLGGRIVFSNEAADRMLGVGAATDASPDEWSDRYGVFLPDGETPFPTDEYPLVRALAGEVTRDVEMLIRNPSLTHRALISVSGRPLLDQDREVVGAAVVFRDITELRKAQQDLEQTVAKLVSTQRMKDELATFIVHDLKNPLTAITTTCDLLMPGLSDEALKSDITAIRDAASRIHRMVLDLLDVQMAEDAALEIESSPLQLRELLADVARAGQPRLAARGQRAEVGDVPSLVVQGDHSLLFRVLMNLVDNCAKYGPRDGRVRINAEDGRPGMVVISVSDEGPGVPERLRERIFDKYAQVERAEGTRSKDSRGLGLRFCKVVTDAHGGRIWVEDAQPQGARFCVELPSS